MVATPAPSSSPPIFNQGALSAADLLALPPLPKGSPALQDPAAAVTGAALDRSVSPEHFPAHGLFSPGHSMNPPSDPMIQSDAIPLSAAESEAMFPKMREDQSNKV